MEIESKNGEKLKGKTAKKSMEEAFKFLWLFLCVYDIDFVMSFGAFFDIINMWYVQMSLCDYMHVV